MPRPPWGLALPESERAILIALWYARELAEAQASPVTIEELFTTVLEKAEMEYLAQGRRKLIIEALDRV